MAHILAHVTKHSGEISDKLLRTIVLKPSYDFCTDLCADKQPLHELACVLSVFLEGQNLLHIRCSPCYFFGLLQRTCARRGSLGLWSTASGLRCGVWHAFRLCRQVGVLLQRARCW
jgi:hypothetical protein